MFGGCGDRRTSARRSLLSVGELPGAAPDATGSLSVANITMIDRRRSAGWDGQVLDYLVSVNARDDEDAAARVRTALEAHGSFSAFARAEG